MSDSLTNTDIPSLSDRQAPRSTKSKSDDDNVTETAEDNKRRPRSKDSHRKSRRDRSREKNRDSKSPHRSKSRSGGLERSGSARSLGSITSKESHRSRRSTRSLKGRVRHVDQSGSVKSTDSITSKGSGRSRQSRSRSSRMERSGSNSTLDSIASHESGRSRRSGKGNRALGRRSSRTERSGSSRSHDSVTSYESGRSRRSRRDQTGMERSGSARSLDSVTSHESGRSRRSRRDRSSKSPADMSPDSRKIQMELTNLGVGQNSDKLHDSTSKGGRARDDWMAKKEGRLSKAATRPGVENVSSNKRDKFREKEKSFGRRVSKVSQVAGTKVVRKAAAVVQVLKQCLLMILARLAFVASSNEMTHPSVTTENAQEHRH